MASGSGNFMSLAACLLLLTCAAAAASGPAQLSTRANKKSWPLNETELRTLRATELRGLLEYYTSDSTASFKAAGITSHSLHAPWCDAHQEQ